MSGQIGPGSADMSPKSQNGSKERAAKGSDGKRSDKPTYANLSLSSAEEFNDAVNALEDIAKIFRYVNRTRDGVMEIEKVHGLCMKQADEIKKLQQDLEAMTFFRDRELQKVFDENRICKKREKDLDAQHCELESRMAKLEAESKAKESKLRAETDKERADMRNKYKQQQEEFQKKVNEDKTRAILDARNSQASEISKLAREIALLRRNNEELEMSGEKCKLALEKKISILECTNISHVERIQKLEKEVKSVTTVDTIVPQMTEF